MVGTRSDRAFSDTHNKRGLVRAFDLTSDKRNDIYFASVTALFVISDKRRFYIYIYIYTMGSRSRRSRSTGRGGSNWKRAALVLPSSSFFSGRRRRRRNWCRGRADSRIPPRYQRSGFSLLFPLPAAFIELLAPSLNSYRARETEEARPVSFLPRSSEQPASSSGARPPCRDPSGSYHYSSGTNELSASHFRFQPFPLLAIAALQFSNGTLQRHFSVSKRFPARSAFPRATFCTVNILSGRLINRA